MILRIYHFTLKLILGVLFLFFTVLGNKEPLLLGPLLILCLCTFLLLSFLQEKYNGKGKMLFLIIVFLLLFIAGKFLDIPNLQLGLMGLLIFWGGNELHDPTNQREVEILFSSFLVGLLVIISSSVGSYPFRGQIVLVLFIQVFLVFLGSFFKKWACVDQDRFSFLMLFLKLCMFLVSIAGLITLTIKFIGFSIAGMIKYPVMLLGLVAIPILNLLKHLLIIDKQPNHKQSTQVISDLLEEANHAKNHSFFITKDIFFISLLIIGLLCIIFFMYKRKRDMVITLGHQPPVSHFSETIKKQSINRLSKKQLPPEDMMRKEIFKFEKYAQKLNCGRFPFETLEEWLKRVGLNENEQVISLYEKIRYGQELATTEEQTFFKTKIRDMKQQLLERNTKKRNKM